MRELRAEDMKIKLNFLVAAKGAVAVLTQPALLPGDVDLAVKWLRASIALAEGKGEEK